MQCGTVELPLTASRDSTVPLAAQITAQLRSAMTEGRLAGGEAGLHVVLQTSRDADADAATASQRGVAVGTLTRFYAGPVTGNGLVIGYGGATRTQIDRGSQILTSAAGIGD
jgi:DNA-binding transcriptional MocR family regulator